MDEQPQMPQIPDPRFLLPSGHPLTQKRISICQACPLSKLPDGLLTGLAQGLFGERSRQCTRCKCFIFLKARVVNAGPLSRCPEGFW